MKVITLWQPWATLIVLGKKKIETRSWRTNHRGELHIHSSAKMTRLMKDLCRQEPFASALKDAPGELPLGKIIGKIDLTHIELAESWSDRAANSQDPQLIEERAFGDYSPGRYAWHLARPVAFAEPVPAIGARMIWQLQRCRQCGCSEFDACIHPTLGPCCWAEPDLCSHCRYLPGQSRRQYPTLVTNDQPHLQP